MVFDDTASIALDFHHSMLSDGTRTNAFLEAILRTVTVGDVVVDIGAGTGVLSLFACLAGARKVYAIEQGPVLDVARELSPYGKEIDAGSDLEELGLDSLRKLELLAVLEERIGVTLTEDLLPEFKTPGKIVEIVGELLDSPSLRKY